MIVLRQPLLLIPGTLCDDRMWQHQVADLEALCAGIQHADITRADSVAAIARQVLRDAPGQFSLAGFSMGGIVAMEIWRQAPHRVLRLALLDTNARQEEPARLQLRLQQMEWARQGMLRDVVVEELMPHYFSEEHQNNGVLREAIMDMALSLGIRVFLRQCQALNSRPDSTNTLASINCPCLVLCGAEDRLCPPALHRVMAAAIPGAELAIIEHSGHFSPLEAPGRVNAAMRQWLAKPSDGNEH